VADPFYPFHFAVAAAEEGALGCCHCQRDHLRDLRAERATESGLADTAESVATRSFVASKTEIKSYYLFGRHCCHYLKNWGSSVGTGCRCSLLPVGCAKSLNCSNYYYYPSYCYLAVSYEVMLSIDSIEAIEAARVDFDGWSTSFYSVSFHPIN
jgi:hypothetical protein